MTQRQQQPCIPSSEYQSNYTMSYPTNNNNTTTTAADQSMVYPGTIMPKYIELN